MNHLNTAAKSITHQNIGVQNHVANASVHSHSLSFLDRIKMAHSAQLVPLRLEPVGDLMHAPTQFAGSRLYLHPHSTLSDQHESPLRASPFHTAFMPNMPNDDNPWNSLDFDRPRLSVKVSSPIPELEIKSSTGISDYMGTSVAESLSRSDSTSGSTVPAPQLRQMTLPEIFSRKTPTNARAEKSSNRIPEKDQKSLDLSPPESPSHLNAAKSSAAFSQENRSTEISLNTRSAPHKPVPFAPTEEFQKFSQYVNGGGREKFQHLLADLATKLEQCPALKTSGQMSASGEPTILNKSQIKHSAAAWSDFSNHIRHRYGRLLQNHKAIIAKEISSKPEFHQGPLNRAKRKEMLIVGGIQMGVSAAFIGVGTIIAATAPLTAGLGALLGAAISTFGLLVGFSSALTIAPVMWSLRKTKFEPKAQLEAKKAAQAAGLGSLPLNTDHVEGTAIYTNANRIRKIRNLGVDISNELSHILKLYREVSVNKNNFVLKGDLFHMFSDCIDQAKAQNTKPNWKHFEAALHARVDKRLRQVEQLIQTQDTLARIAQNDNNKIAKSSFTSAPAIDVKPGLAADLWATWLVDKRTILEEGRPIGLGDEICNALSKYQILESNESEQSKTGLSVKDVKLNIEPSIGQLVRRELKTAQQSLRSPFADNWHWKQPLRNLQIPYEFKPASIALTPIQQQQQATLIQNQLKLVNWAEEYLVKATRTKPEKLENYLQCLPNAKGAQGDSADSQQSLQKLMQYMIVEREFDHYLNTYCPDVFAEIRNSKSDLTG